jgi:hypothetical protein
MYVCLQVGYTPDSDSYLEFARVLTGQASPAGPLYFRTPGYPVLMILTGVASGKTFLILLAVQALMGALIPLLIYWAMLVIDRRLALWCAVAAIVSLVPYLHSKDVMTEQPYLFCQFLALCLASRYMAHHRVGNLYAMTATLVAAALIRPSGTLLFVPFLLAAYLAARSRWLHCLACLGLFLGCLAGWSSQRSRLFAPQIPFGGLTNAGGKNAFCAIQMPSAMLTSAMAHGSLPGAVQPENGPWTWKMIALMTRAVGSERVEKMLRSPHRDDYMLCWSKLDDAVGPVEADRILLHTTLEAVRRHPYLVAIYLRNLIDFLVGFPPASTWGVEPSPATLFPHVPFDYSHHGYPAVSHELSPQMRSELDQDFLGGRVAGWRDAVVDKYYGLGYTFGKGVVLVVVLVTLPRIWPSKHRLFLLLCLAIVGYQAVVVSLCAMPAFRYHVPVMLVEVMVALSGVHLARQGTKRTSSSGAA